MSALRVLNEEQWEYSKAGTARAMEASSDTEILEMLKSNEPGTLNGLCMNRKLTDEHGRLIMASDALSIYKGVMLSNNDFSAEFLHEMAIALLNTDPYLISAISLHRNTNEETKVLCTMALGGRHWAEAQREMLAEEI